MALQREARACLADMSHKEQSTLLVAVSKLLDRVSGASACGAPCSVCRRSAHAGRPRWYKGGRRRLPAPCTLRADV